jgi:hypothetical protein
MRNKDLTKQSLYEGVKLLVETEDQHLHFAQQKLFTLFSIGFQYLLFQSTKQAGSYILRIEDSALAEKLAKRAKDPSTRKFLQGILVPRKIKYGKSTFFLDFFHVGSWALTADIPAEKLKGALIVKNTNSRPMTELVDEEADADDPINIMATLPEDYFLTTLIESCPETITIAFDGQYEQLTCIEFPFIQKEKERVQGLTVSKEVDLDSIDD